MFTLTVSTALPLLFAFAALLASETTAQTVQAAQAPDTSTWTQFSSFTYAGRAAVVPRADEYQNPIIAGFYPDPSVCRVGDDYYLVNSSFSYFPGLPVWHSNDLVNWTQLGHAIDRPSQYTARGGAVSAGLYAPAINYHNGTFYIVCTLIGGVGNFYVTAKDPQGPWSDPIPLRGVGGIDSAFFFDDDGKCYVLNCDEPPGGKPEYEGHRTIRLQEVELEQKKVVGEQTILVNGGTDISQHPVWCEGPHLYKINGAYYLMCAQGGTGTAHTEVVFKSDALRGPYIPAAHNPILSTHGLSPDRANPVTCTGHADLVQTQNGEWFAVFLACQPYQNGFYNTGRQTFLLPVTWENGWPVILPPQTPVPLAVKKPKLPVGTAAAVPTTGDITYTDRFNSDALHPRWIGLRVPDAKWYQLSKTSESLLMQPRPDLLSGKGNPSFLAVRQQNNDFNCSVTLTAQAKTVNCLAGLTAFQNEGHYYAINVKIEAGHLASISLEQSAPLRGRRQPGQNEVATPQPKGLATAKLPDNLTSIRLELEGTGAITKCFYTIGEGERVQLGENLESSFLSTETAGGFQGVVLGMFARTE